jgi:hypothetical protein
MSLDTLPSGFVRTKGLAVRKQPLIKAKMFIKCFIKKRAINMNGIRQGIE